MRILLYEHSFIVTISGAGACGGGKENVVATEKVCKVVHDVDNSYALIYLVHHLLHLLSSNGAVMSASGEVNRGNRGNVCEAVEDCCT